jgi:hypothetical protein
MPNGVPAPVKVLPEMWTKSEAGTVAGLPASLSSFLTGAYRGLILPQSCATRFLCSAGGEGARTCADYEIRSARRLRRWLRPAYAK